MIKRKTTLIVTAVMLVVSIVLLSTASLAWFTLSTAPEVSGMRVTLFTDQALLVSKTPNPEDFTQSIDLSELFQYYAPLKPISTYDGKSWFLPAYEFDGRLKDPASFPLATEENMNVKIYDANGKLLEGLDLYNAQNKGYYVSCEFYLATQLEEDVTVTLSAPDLTKNNLEDWETDVTNPHSFRYGSYAMAALVKAETSPGVYTARAVDNNAQTALRVGFMVDEGTDSEKFTIYEPNADLRSMLEIKDANGQVMVTKPKENNGYVSGYTINATTYKDNNYIPTLPIKLVTNAQGVPVGQATALDPDSLIVQMSGAWANSYADKVIAAPNATPYFPNSGDIARFGKFIWNTSDVNGNNASYSQAIAVENIEKNLASGTQIVTLEGRDGETIHPKKVTMYIWVEGQDVDCWNDIAGGTFVVNLEFAAREKEQDPTPAE